MKLTEILDSQRTHALAIQQHIVEEFDDDNLASSGETRVGCDLTMELGYPAVKLTIDLLYYKEALFLYHGKAPGTIGSGYFARETLPGNIIIGHQHDMIPQLLEATIKILATEGPATATEKSFGYYFKKAYRFPDEKDGFHPDTITTIMTRVLKGKRVMIVSKDRDTQKVSGYCCYMVNGNQALMIET